MNLESKLGDFEEQLVKIKANFSSATNEHQQQEEELKQGVSDEFGNNIINIIQFPIFKRTLVPRQMINARKWCTCIIYGLTECSTICFLLFGHCIYCLTCQAKLYTQAQTFFFPGQCFLFLEIFLFFLQFVFSICCFNSNITQMVFPFFTFLVVLAVLYKDGGNIGLVLIE